jgi:membrane fusion protein (multidrug efflux system)
MLPAIAVISELKGQYVFLAKNGKAIKHPVRTGYRAPQQIEILEGLSVGDSVLRTGILLVQNEGRISIVK